MGRFLSLFDLNLFKEIKKNLKHNQTGEKQIEIPLFFFFSFNNRSCQYQKHLNSIGKDPNYDLITPNGIIVFIEVEELRKLVIPVGITRSQRVNLSNYRLDKYLY